MMRSGSRLQGFGSKRHRRDIVVVVIIERSFSSGRSDTNQMISLLRSSMTRWFVFYRYIAPTALPTKSEVRPSPHSGAHFYTHPILSAVSHLRRDRSV